MTPENKTCPWCDETFAQGDAFRDIPHMGTDVTELRRWHMECFMRSILGSVSHQQGTCSCYVPGSTSHDAPELTARQAAKAALEFYEAHGTFCY